MILPDYLKAEFAKHSQHHVIKALDQLIIFAVNHNASDIHVEPEKQELKIRLRIDGVLHLALCLPVRFSLQILSRLKILASLDIAEKRLPQDGRFVLDLGQESLNGRISTCPTVFGEKAVIRLLASSKNYLSLEEQGMSEKQLEAVLHLIKSPHGLVIVSGPTGSGKSMTLYSLLNKLNNGERNLISVEDPVEMILAGVNQVQIEEKSGLDFKKILRHLLRQDPDVLMIGEIRDAETAEIAIKAAQTGHLVLSTLHTASAAQAISRLEQLGVPRYLILEATRLLIAQRLIRKSCPSCQSGMNGFKGRTGIFELIDFNSSTQKKFVHHQELEPSDYVDHLDLKAAGLKKVELGISTLDEVLRVI